MTKKTLISKWLAAAAIAIMGTFVPTKAAAETVYGITNNTNLAVFTTEDTSAVTLTNITNLQPDETLLAMDIHPATGDILAVGSTTRVYKIDPNTAEATQVGTATFEGDLNDPVNARYGMDIDPLLDVIRFVSTAEDNVTLDPYGIAAPNVETDLSPDSTVTDIAFSNSFPGTISTELFGIDSDSDSLVSIDANGNISTVGPLNVDFSTSSSIDYHGTSLYAVLNIAGENQLHLINPINGNATFLGTIQVAFDLVSMAIVPDSLIVSGKKGPLPPKVKINLNFAKPFKDKISVKGALSIPDDFEVGGQIITVDVGGVNYSLELDVKGKAKVVLIGGEVLVVKVKVKAKKIDGVPTVLAQDAKYKINFKKGNWASEFENEGLINADISGLPVEVPVSINLGDHFYQTKMTLVYKAKLDKKGKAK